MTNSKTVNWKSVLVPGLVVAILAIGIIALQGQSFSADKASTVIEQCDNCQITNEAESFGVGFGAASAVPFAAPSEDQTDLATSSTDTTQLGGVTIQDRLRFGDNETEDINSVTQKFLFLDFSDATSTIFSIKNEEGQTIYIDRMGFEFSSMATNTVAIFVGTTSAGVIPTDDATQRAITNPANTLTALVDNFLITDGTALDATGTIVWLPDNEGDYKPTSRGFGQDMRNIPILAGEFITAYASSTLNNDVITLTKNLFAGKVYIQYRFLK